MRNNEVVSHPIAIAFEPGCYEMLFEPNRKHRVSSRRIAGCNFPPHQGSHERHEDVMKQNYLSLLCGVFYYQLLLISNELVF